ncbi:hypothetical protein O3M35_004782 [Rhynocoris fuscipes]|uniref:Uncharacterized protein n=1 Tax=Rhynocoris fuscipes TaxID=488301 RepID=A0AAW1DGQ3_9HEMI
MPFNHRWSAGNTGLLESRGFTCYDKVYAVDSGGTSIYADFVAFDNNSDLAYMLHPTVRYEANGETSLEVLYVRFLFLNLTVLVRKAMSVSIQSCR